MDTKIQNLFTRVEDALTELKAAVEAHETRRTLNLDELAADLDNLGSTLRSARDNASEASSAASSAESDAQNAIDELESIEERVKDAQRG